MGNDAHQTVSLRQGKERFHHFSQRVLVERPEALVDEQRVEPDAARGSLDLVGEAQRQRERGHEALPARERVGVSHGVVVVIDHIQLQAALFSSVGRLLAADKLILIIGHREQPDVGMGQDPVEIHHLDIGLQHDPLFSQELSVGGVRQVFDPHPLFFDLGRLGQLFRDVLPDASVRVQAAEDLFGLVVQRRLFRLEQIPARLFRRQVDFDHVLQRFFIRLYRGFEPDDLLFPLFDCLPGLLDLAAEPFGLRLQTTDLGAGLDPGGIAELLRQFSDAAFGRVFLFAQSGQRKLFVRFFFPAPLQTLRLFRDQAFKLPLSLRQSAQPRQLVGAGLFFVPDVPPLIREEPYELVVVRGGHHSRGVRDGARFLRFDTRIQIGCQFTGLHRFPVRFLRVFFRFFQFVAGRCLGGFMGRAGVGLRAADRTGLPLLQCLGQNARLLVQIGLLFGVVLRFQPYGFIGSVPVIPVGRSQLSLQKADLVDLFLQGGDRFEELLPTFQFGFRFLLVGADGRERLQFRFQPFRLAVQLLYGPLPVREALLRFSDSGDMFLDELLLPVELLVIGKLRLQRGGLCVRGGNLRFAFLFLFQRRRQGPQYGLFVVQSCLGRIQILPCFALPLRDRQPLRDGPELFFQRFGALRDGAGSALVRVDQPVEQRHDLVHGNLAGLRLGRLQREHIVRIAGDAADIQPDTVADLPRLPAQGALRFGEPVLQDLILLRVEQLLKNLFPLVGGRFQELAEIPLG